MHVNTLIIKELQVRHDFTGRTHVARRQINVPGRKSGNADNRRIRGFDFSIKVHFEGQRGRVKHGEAILAGRDVPLDIAGYFRSQTPFQVFADQSNGRFARDAHDAPL